jgi:predicted phage baseplate assembly protein
MPLPKPTLDNRRFDQLVAESVGVLGRGAPEWTDHNASDPGITLLELAAWLGEQNIYRFDRLSDEAKRAFVRLAGIEPQPAGVASTVVSLASTTALTLPARIQLGLGDDALFETVDALFVSPAQMSRVAVDGSATVDPTANNAARVAFDAFGARPRPGAALRIAFDHALDAPGAALALHCWTDHWQRDEATRAALIAEAGGCSTAPASDWRRHYRVNTVWEYWSAQGWHGLPDVVDETRALTLSGFVRFAAPVGHAPAPDDGLFYVRCRIASGRYECPPRLLHVAFNAVAAQHALTRASTSLGTSRGHAGAVFPFGEAPIAAGSVALTLDNGAGVVQDDWREAADWDRAGAHDRVFRLDAGRGELQSGDGLRGTILPAGFQLIAMYRQGGGPRGNLAAGTLNAVPATAVNLQRAPVLATLSAPLAVLQPFAAHGGSERESIEHAQARAFENASAVDKAVTLEDIERIALATPGVPIARASAVTNFDPLLPCYPALGAITVVAIPCCPRPAPLPSRALLDAIARYIEPRRLVTSEIHVVPPRYRRVSVQATLYLACGGDARKVEQAARARIDSYFDALTGGPDGSGWPFGRAVYRSEMMALLVAIDGVERVTAFGFITGASSRPLCDNVVLCPTELVRPGRHRLRVDSDLARNFNRSEPHECEST